MLIDRCFQTNDLRISLVRDNGISIIYIILLYSYIYLYYIYVCVRHVYVSTIEHLQP